MTSAGEELIVPGATPPLAALAFGPRDAPPVLALHGWLDNAASFQSLAAALPDVRLVAVDLPGHGRSGHRSPDASYHLIDGVPEVFRIADGFGWDKLTVIGHSLGATLATLAAGARPERFRGLALIEGLIPLTAAPHEAPARTAAWLAALLGPRRPLTVYPTEAAALATRAKAGEFVHPEAMLPVVRRGLKEVPGGFVWRSDPRLRLPTPVRLTLEQAAAFLPRITCPMLIVRAQQGLLRDRERFQALTEFLPDVTVAEMEGYHHVHLDDPAGVARHVGAFLAQLP